MTAWSGDKDRTVASLSSQDRGQDDEQPSLIASILRNRRRLVLFTTAVTVATTIALTSQQTKTYDATASVVVQTPPSAPTAQPNMATELQIARSLAVAQIVEKHLQEAGTTPQLLQRDLSVRVPVDSDVLKITYSSPDPTVAQARSEAFAQAYIEYRQAQVDAQVRLAKIPGSYAPAVLLGQPLLPRSPSSPNLTLNVILALFGGLLLGLTLAAVREYLDDRVRGVGDLQARLRVPLLAVVPPKAEGAQQLTELPVFEPSNHAREAFRRLRANVVVAAENSGARALAVTSIGSDDPGTVVSAQLGVALAATGRRVILVSTRRGEPRLEALFGVPDEVGFLDAVAGAVPVEKAVHRSSFKNLVICSRGSAAAARAEPQANGNGSSQAAPTPLGLPIDLLASDQAGLMIGRLVGMADLVVIDVPPLLADADAAALVTACDGVLTVVGTPASRSEIAQAREVLDRIGATVIGSVVVDRPRRQKERQAPVQAEPVKPARPAEQPAAKERQVKQVKQVKRASRR
jgi:capsular polysaccharide biosynthesis protein/Mrp family chromosome partitioning ATPase